MTTHIQQTSLERHCISAEAFGPTVVITARIHGDEPAGEKACRAVLSKFRRGLWGLERGSVIILPSVHPEAARLNKRGIESDCNRGLTKEGLTLRAITPNNNDLWVREAIYSEVRHKPEAILILPRVHQRELREHGFYFLDLHSTPEASPPHVIAERWDGINQKLAQSTGIAKVFTNWRKACLAVTDHELKSVYPDQRSLCSRDARDVWGHHNTALIHLAEASGYKGSICVEGGQNNDPLAVSTHISAIAGYLHSLGILKAPAQDIPTPPSVLDTHRFERLFIQTGGDAIAPEAKAGDTFLHRSTGEQLRLVEGETLLHVFPDAPTGKPLAFTARKLAL